MKTFGLINPDGTRELQSLLLSYGQLPGEYNVNQLCPRGKHWTDDPDAPWNRFWSANQADWVAIDAQWSSVPAETPTAPWNLPEPSRNPADYGDLLWVAPSVIPLIKGAIPEATSTQVPAPDPANPYWFEDRVESRWILRDKTNHELRESARATLRTTWAAQPAWIRGPFDGHFRDVQAFLDAHDDDAAAARIEYAEAPGAYTSEQLATFVALKTQIVAAIAALP